jgi:hypothetical protein
MKIIRFRKRYWVTLLVMIGIYFLGTAGPLLAWSPVKPGYTELKAQTYTVYYPEATEVPEYYKTLDPYIKQYSEQLDLPLKKNIKLIRTNKANIQKYLPWMSTESIGGAALQTGDVLYISYEKIAEQGLSEEEFVKHEVIHLLHHQNATILNSFNAGKRTYMSEGVPFYAGGPRYYSREEFLERLRKATLEETTEGDTIYTEQSFAALDRESGEQYKVSHMLYGEFIVYLIATYSQEKFNAFNHAFQENPFMHRELFEEHFGQKLEVVLQEFEESLL